MNAKNSENTTSQENAIELGTLRDSKNLEDKINIDGEEEDDDDDLYGADVMENFKPTAFYILKREQHPRLFFIHLVSWPYPLLQIIQLYYLFRHISLFQVFSTISSFFLALYLCRAYFLLELNR